MKAKRSYIEQSESDFSAEEEIKPVVKKSKKTAESGSELDEEEEEEDLDELRQEAKKFVKSKA